MLIVLVSDDGKKFHKVAEEHYGLADWDHINSIESYKLAFEPVTAQYIRVRITGHQLPSGHTGFGHPAWLFVDEIEIE